MPNHHTLKAWQHAERLARRFLDTAWGSLAEVQTALVMARDIGYLRAAEFGRLEALATETSKTLFGLLRKVTLAIDRPKSG
jgi:four helix bundle protein